MRKHSAGSHAGFTNSAFKSPLSDPFAEDSLRFHRPFGAALVQHKGENTEIKRAVAFLPRRQSPRCNSNRKITEPEQTRPSQCCLYGTECF